MERFKDMIDLRDSIILAWSTTLWEDAETDRRRELLLFIDHEDMKYLADIAVSSVAYYIYSAIKEVWDADEK